MKKILVLNTLFIMMFTILFSSCSDISGNMIKTNAESVSVENTTNEVTSSESNFKLPDSGQSNCYGNDSEIVCPLEGEDYYGNDAQYGSNGMRYQDNGDGTVTDLNTGLMWTTDISDGITFDDANDTIDDIDTAGYDDWRIPTTTELYSLITFDGTDPSGYSGDDTDGMIPFIDSEYFDFEYGGGGGSKGNRIIDVQGITSTMYESTVMNNDECFFGVNFADGRIKCYSLGWEGQYFRILYVRGNSGYGEVDLVDNGDGTVTENNTDLVWQQGDSGESMQWKEALAYCSELELGGRDDWRLPNTKELQYIVDYTRSPDTTDSAAIYEEFDATSIINEAGEEDYGFYWTSTTHRSFVGANAGAYVSFGRSLGYMGTDDEPWVDVHGAGSQRSDPKDGDGADYPTGNGPQGDVIRGYNMVRCVSGGDNTFNSDIEYTDNAYLEYYEGYEPSESDMNMIVGSSTSSTEVSSVEGNQMNNQIPSMEERGERGSGMGGMQDSMGMQGGMQAGAPEEAISACESTEVGETCSFSTPNGDISGTCSEVEESVIACFPENMQR